MYSASAPAQSQSNSLFTDPSGRLALDFNVGGTLGRPALRADLERTAKRTNLKALGEQELQRLLAPLGVPDLKSRDAVGRALGGAVKDLFRPKPAPRESTSTPAARDSTP